MTKRKIGRTLLSNFLCEAIDLGIIIKEDKIYLISELGLAIQAELERMRNVLITDNEKCDNIPLVELERI